MFECNNISDSNLKTECLNSLIGNTKMEYSNEYISAEDKYKAKLETFFDKEKI